MFESHLKTLNETLDAIPKDSNNIYTWQSILPILGMNTCRFKDADEETFAYNWIVGKLELFGDEYISENASAVLYEWELAKEKYHRERKQEQQKRKQKKELE